MVFFLDPFRAQEEHRLGKNAAGERIHVAFCNTTSVPGCAPTAATTAIGKCEAMGQPAHSPVALDVDAHRRRQGLMLVEDYVEVCPINPYKRSGAGRRFHSPPRSPSPSPSFPFRSFLSSFAAWTRGSCAHFILPITLFL